MSEQDNARKAEISELVDRFRRAIAGGSSLDAEVRLLARYIPVDLVREARIEFEYEAGTIRQLEDPRALVERYEEQGDWYAGVPDDATFWPPLRKRLESDIDQDGVNSVNRASDRILSLMKPPGDDFSTRGLVLGYVQSGKTTSFMSVMAKAADYGYRLFVVLSGITDNLRNQTQERLDELLIGDLTNKYFRLTELGSDFVSPGNAAFLLGDPNKRLVAVVKKNPYRLRKLVRWVEEAGEATMRTCPILVIDDEADQASIDVGKSRRSAINDRIRSLLDRPKAAYVAYSATPFANLLIEPAQQEGLYPRDFIVDLPRPANYFGPEKIFGHRTDADDEPADGLNIVRDIPVDEFSAVQPPRGRGAVDTWQPSLAPSLAEAVRWFVLASAARQVRRVGQRHSSMLIHTSMLAAAHQKLAVPVTAFLQSLSTARDGDAEWQALRDLWERESPLIPGDTDEIAVAWTELEPQIAGVLAACEVVVDNYLSTARLSYGATGQTTIVIGGNTLSRGLTLAGLVCSYFVRSAAAYDTLLQMGRWFGYRKGYSDLVRIWMPGELQDWFADLAGVEEEIRADIARYATDGENVTPLQLAVRIRQHPKMRITAAAKMRHAITVSTSYSRQRPQTILFNHRDAAWLGRNITAARDLVAGLTFDGNSRPVFKNVDVNRIESFLGNYQFHERAKDLDVNLLREYVQRQNDLGALLTWNVVIFEHPSDTNDTLDLGISRPVNLIVRSRVDIPDIPHANIKSLVSTIDRVGDTPYRRGELENMTSISKLPPRDPKRKLTDRLLLDEVRMGEWDVPLLGLYPINRTSEPDSNRRSRKKGERLRKPLDAVDDVIGVCLFFPKAAGKEQDSYVSAPLSPVDEEPDDAIEAEFDALDRADERAGEEQERAAEAAVGRG